MGALARGLTKAGEAIDRISGWIALFAIMVMLAAMMLQIVARYIFDAPPVWTEELARYAMIWACMLGATMAYYRRGDPVLFRPSTVGRPRLAIVVQLVELSAIVVLAAPVLWFAPAFLGRHMARITETLELNSAAVVSIIPLSFIVIVFHGLTRMVVTVNEARQGGQPAAPSDRQETQDVATGV